MRRIRALLERLDADTMDHFDEPLAIFALRTIELDDALDGRGNFFLRHGGSDDLAQCAKPIHRAAERDLIPLFAMLLDAQDADVPDVVMPAGIHAPGHLDLDVAEIVEIVEIVEARL